LIVELCANEGCSITDSKDKKEGEKRGRKKKDWRPVTRSSIIALPSGKSQEISGHFSNSKKLNSQMNFLFICLNNVDIKLFYYLIPDKMF
jgi:hypothetical protein